MKVLLLSRYDRLGASSRVRSYQYLPYLEGAGLSITVAPMFGDGYLRALYAGRGRVFSEWVSAYFRRVADVLACGEYDVVWLEYEAFPWLPAWAEEWLAWRGIPYVVDYDDAIFHRYDLHRNALVRLALGRKIDRVMRHAALVLAGNSYLAERAQRVGARRVEYLPTSVDVERYRQRSNTAGEQITVGWIGTPVTARYLYDVADVLAKLQRETGVRVVLVGAGKAEVRFPCDVRPWSEATEVADLQTFDIGIMPLPDTSWERGKCGYKLIQYMACGKPVVASPVGVNQSIVAQGINGFLAQEPAEWEQALRALIADPALRERMGQAGRRRVEEEFSVQVNAPKLAAWLREVGERRG